MSAERHGRSIERAGELRARLVPADHPHLEAVRAEFALERASTSSVNSDNPSSVAIPAQVTDQEKPRAAAPMPLPFFAPAAAKRIGDRRAQVGAVARTLAPEPRGMVRGEVAGGLAVVEEPHIRRGCLRTAASRPGSERR